METEPTATSRIMLCDASSTELHVWGNFMAITNTHPDASCFGMTEVGDYHHSEGWGDGKQGLVFFNQVACVYEGESLRRFADNA